jgi:hypothetical protein
MPGFGGVDVVGVEEGLIEAVALRVRDGAQVDALEIEDAQPHSTSREAVQCLRKPVVHRGHVALLRGAFDGARASAEYHQVAAAGIDQSANAAMRLGERAIRETLAAQCRVVLRAEQRARRPEQIAVVGSGRIHHEVGRADARTRGDEALHLRGGARGVGNDQRRHVERAGARAAFGEVDGAIEYQRRVIGQPLQCSPAVAAGAVVARRETGPRTDAPGIEQAVAEAPDHAGLRCARMRKREQAQHGQRVPRAGARQVRRSIFIGHGHDP